MTRIASFFAGIGGLELGIEAALGGDVVFQCESDPYARSILERHWPAVARHPDITTLRPDEIPHADVWCGGFPCQDISVAGKQEGIRGARSGLFFEWMRLVRAVRPRFLVMENVPAILAGDNLGPVLGELAEAGYDAEWDVLGAWQVGAPHQRDRFFLIGWLAANANKERQRQPQGSQSDEWRWPDDGSQTAREGAPDSDARSLGVQKQIQGANPCGWRQRWPSWSPAGPAGAGRWNGRPRSHRPGRSELLGVDDGIPYWSHRVARLGNAVVPQCAYVIGLRLRELMQAGRGGLRYPGARGPCGMGAH